MMLFALYGAPVIGIIFVIFGAMRGWWSDSPKRYRSCDRGGD